MVGENGHDGAEAGLDGGGKFSGYRKDTQWDRACGDAERCTEVHQAEPGETAVYVIADALGNHKIGVTGDAAARVCELEFTVERERRPLRLRRAILMSYAIAYRVERRAHRLLASAALGGEWFAATQDKCVAAVRDAIVAVAIDEKLANNGRTVHLQKLQQGRRELAFPAEVEKSVELLWRNVRDYPREADVAKALKKVHKDYTTFRARRKYGPRKKRKS